MSANILNNSHTERWFCKLFDKALEIVLAREALAMCLQM